MIGTERTVQARLDDATSQDLTALERHLRLNATSVIRLAIAALARREGVSVDQDQAGKRGPGGERSGSTIAI